MKRIRLSLSVLLVAIFVGCAGLPVEEEYLTTELPQPEQRIGVYHKVNKGETLWRIAKTYDISLTDIIRMNNIPDVAQLEKNQLIFIPGAHSVRQIVVETQESENDFIWPVNGDVIGHFHQHVGNRINKGINIKASQGSLVFAARSGKVVFADELTGYGKTVILSHSGGFHTIYAQNSEILVKLGDYTLKNNPIAKVGRHQRLAYLHFEIRKGGIESNPLHYLP